MRTIMQFISVPLVYQDLNVYIKVMSITAALSLPVHHTIFLETTEL